MEKEKIKNNTELESGDEVVDEGFEAYRKMLERQRKWLEAHPDVKVAYYVPPKKENSDN